MRGGYGIACLAIVLLVVGVVAFVPVAEAESFIRGEPDFRVVGPEQGVAPGEHATVTAYLQNDPEIRTATGSGSALERVTTARGVRMTVSAGGAPVTVRTGTVALGSVSEGQTPVALDLVVDEDADPGTYRLPVRIQYSYTNMISESSGVHQERTRTARTHLELEIEEGSRFKIVDVEPAVRVGERGTLSMTMENVGDEPARNANVELRAAGTQIGVGNGSGGNTFVERWASGERRTLTFDVSVPDDVDARTFGLAAVVDYEDHEGARTDSSTRHVGFVPQPRPAFELGTVDTTIPVGDRGPIVVDVRYTGDRPLEDASLVARSTAEHLRIDGDRAGEVFVGRWAPGERRAVAFTGSFAAEAGVRNYSLEVTPHYEALDGPRAAGEPMTVGVRPRSEQTFAIDATSSLRIDEPGVITGTIENTGPLTVRGLSVAVANDSTVVRPADGEAGVGTLGPGEQARFRLRVRVSEGVEPGGAVVPLITSYRTQLDDRRRTDADVGVAIGERRDALVVEPERVDIPAGDDGIVVASVRNNLDETIREVRFGLTVPEEFDSEYVDGYADRLAPGEETTIRFDVDTDSAAVPQRYAAEMDVTYLDERGERRETRTYGVPFEVVPRDEVLPVDVFLVLLVVLVLGLGLAYWIYGSDLNRRLVRFRR